MRSTDIVILGAGQAGLAASACLSERNIDHVLLERGRVGERWRSERWDSLSLLTPRWQTRLPGWTYQGDDPHGFMSKRELIAMLAGYAASVVAPVEEGTEVRAVTRRDERFEIATSGDSWRARGVVVATGACDKPLVPPGADGLTLRVRQVTPHRYRSPEDLEPGGVLVVGGSATGVQLAEEIRRSGREVVLSVGNHARVPRTWRGRDIQWWLEHSGLLSERFDQVRDLHAARSAPSLQLVGGANPRAVDLPTLRALGVRLVGRFVTARGESVRFADDLPDAVESAERRLDRLLARIDGFADELDGPWTREARPTRFVAGPTPTQLDLRAEGIRTVIWATGFRRTYPWLHLPVLRDGELVQRGGETPIPGLVALGLPMMRTRKSTYLDGVGDDARFLAARLAAHLENSARRAA
ncbi:MAG: pyridine nucleotide-disulfide oxidoreductase [Deltaproteobacteria bacterium]|nr:MAG: pyridine nucleotide-disulfide oxidoreductase [Deltaproteobacteria bacterium]